MSIEQSPEIGAIAGAIAEAQGKLKTLAKERTVKIPTKSGTGYSYNYADLVTVWNEIRPICSAGKIAVIQLPLQDGELVGVSTMLAHESGQWIRSTLWAMPVDSTPQSVGSVVTYLRRYGLSAMLGLVADDDTDGHSGYTTQPQAEQKQKPPAQAQKPIEKPQPAPVVLSDQQAALKADMKKLGAHHAGAEKALVMKLLGTKGGKLVEELTPDEFTLLENQIIAALERAQ